MAAASGADAMNGVEAPIASTTNHFLFSDTPIVPSASSKSAFF